MHLAKPYVVIVLVLTVLCFETDGQKACSCYTFEGGATERKSWPQAKTSCEDQKKHLVTMETEREWEFIKNEIQNRTNAEEDEWLIGLFRNSTNANWTWVSGQPLTIDKWQESMGSSKRHIHEPGPVDLYGLIAKNYPTGTFGLFGGITKNPHREWICEEETDNCTGTCMYLVATTAGSTTSGKRNVPDDKGDRTVVIELTVSLAAALLIKLFAVVFDRTTVIVSLAAVYLLIALIALAVALFLKRKKRRPQDDERPEKKSSNPLEDQHGPILNPENAATQLGLSETECCSKREYTELNQLTMMPGENFHTSLEEVEQEFSDSGSWDESLTYVNQMSIRSSPTYVNQMPIGSWDESPTYVNQMPMPEYMNLPV